ncbi:MAG: ADP-specific phosphofructokinase [Melioribacteraceae bacterium]|nr:MAG: ADP-specific phosphofructokinase [Melioribacteraceae bacterium]
MEIRKLQEIWKDHFNSSGEQLKKMAEVNGLISAFNANIDAVIKISGEKIEKIIDEFGLNPDHLIQDNEQSIRSVEDAIRGLIRCFRGGFAEEWLIEEKEVFEWLNKNIGYDKLQMGGQGGIVANVMATCEVGNVYVHTASSPKEQSGLFQDLPNLQNVDLNGELKKAYEIDRHEDIPLIHWIIEFDKNDKLNIGGENIVCPKSNRFIATYDPLNFSLTIDQAFHKKMSEPTKTFEYIILSGYQMLKEKLNDGRTGTERIDESILAVNEWLKNNPDSLLHFEIASTRDKVVRKYLVDKLAPKADSVGFNERELIDILEVIGEEELAGKCDKETSSSNLFEGMLKVFEYTGCSRMQLHMFGLYITLQKKGFRVTPIQNRNGMQLAANIAATKAGTGAIDSHEILLWSKDKDVSEVGLNELTALSEKVSELFGNNDLCEKGIFTDENIEIIAVPTIIIDKPITLVGMGDTISSISLVAAR